MSFVNLPEKGRGPRALNLAGGEMEKLPVAEALARSAIEFSEWRDGYLRHPSFAGMRGNKEPQRIVRNRPPGRSPGLQFGNFYSSFRIPPEGAEILRLRYGLSISKFRWRFGCVDPYRSS